MKEFHKPFLKNLILIALVTIVSMVFVPTFVALLIGNTQKNQTFTIIKSSSPSNISTNHTD